MLPAVQGAHRGAPLPLQVLALKELPSACAGGSKDVWRGVKLNLEKQFPQDSTFTWYL